MRRLRLSVLMLIICSSAYAETALTSRYRQVIGAQLFGEIFATTYGCPLPQGGKRMYNYDRTRQGVLIIDTRDNSPARQAGLQCRDIVVAIDGRHVKFPSEMRDMVAAAKDGRIEISYITPRDRADIAMDVVYDDDIRKVTVATTTLDEVVEQKKLVPVQAYFSIADVFGPKFIFETSTTFEEVLPGLIRYECSMTHHGDQEVLPVESPLLPYLGVTELFTNLGRNNTQTFARHADVATDGIPVLTTIKLGVARRIDADGEDMVRFMAKYPGSSVSIVAGVEGRERYYSWRDTAIKCFLPEKLSRELDGKERRLRSVR